jgi:hypothetical protein
MKLYLGDRVPAVVTRTLLHGSFYLGNVVQVHVATMESDQESPMSSCQCEECHVCDTRAHVMLCDDVMKTRYTP